MAGAICLIVAIVLFVLDAVGKSDIGGFGTQSVGLAFFAASFLVGAAVTLYRSQNSN